ncbi:hypothetical protein V1477_001211 [Vespula maculifrons]|uniref:Uncharacterized protein n=1 Tax=Vespula maculifrons TaxID=7453 RepID=A0ABD2CZS5_VESMC
MEGGQATFLKGGHIKRKEKNTDKEYTRTSNYLSRMITSSTRVCVLLKNSETRRHVDRRLSEIRKTNKGTLMANYAKLSIKGRLRTKVEIALIELIHTLYLLLVLLLSSSLLYYYYKLLKSSEIKYTVESYYKREKSVFCENTSTEFSTSSFTTPGFRVLLSNEQYEGLHIT